jgi:hypothetical protein
MGSAEETDKKETLESRRSKFGAFVRESDPVLVDFLQRLEFPDPHVVLQDATKYVAPIDAWLRDQTIDPSDRIWILSRIGYFLGELLKQKYGGEWFIDEDPESPYFLQYVMGKFTRATRPFMKLPPFALADFYLSQPPGRSFQNILARVDREFNPPCGNIDGHFTSP